MIDFIEAYESAVNTDFADWGKIAIFTGLVYYCYHLYDTSQVDLFYYVAGTTLYLLLVFMLCIINNVRSCKNYVLPMFKSWQFAGFALKTLVSVVPLVALLIWGGLKILSLDILSTYPEILPICSWIVWIIFGAIATMATLLFAKTGNPLSVLDIKTIAKYSIDILPQLFLIFAVMIVFNIIVIGIIAYVFGVLLTLKHPIFIGICSLAVVLNVIALGSCLAQLEYQVVPTEEEEHII